MAKGDYRASAPALADRLVERTRRPAELAPGAAGIEGGVGRPLGARGREVGLARGLDAVRRKREDARDAQAQLMAAEPLGTTQVEAAGQGMVEEAADGVCDRLGIDGRAVLVGEEAQTAAGGDGGGDPFARRRARSEAAAQHEGHARDRRLR